MKRRHPLTLIEVAIVMVLAAILLGTLFYTQTDMAHAQVKVEKAKAVVMARQKLMLRLNQIFTSHADFRFEKPNLILKYDNGVDYDRTFSGPVTSLLYLDDGKVCLATWGENDASRVDVLLEGVEKLSFTFFDNKKNSWEPTVPEENFTMFKMVIDNKLEFPFFL